MRIALLYPPDDSVPVTPFGALPLLQACARRAGHQVLALDSAAASFRWLARERNVAELYSYARSRTAAAPHEGLERRLAIPEELAMGAERAALELRDPAVYFDPERYRECWRAIHAVRELYAFLRPPFGPRNRDFNAMLYAHLARGDPLWERVFDEVLLARLRAFDPELVALSVPFSTQIASSMELARWLHARFPGVPVVGGGTSFSDAETVLLSESRFYDFIDYASVGDGEEALVELCAVLGGRGDPADVPALYHRARDGAIVAPRNRRLTNLDHGPTPDFRGLDFSLYLTPEPVVSLTTSRGCYYGKCTFCSESFKPSFRRRSSPLVWEDVRALALEQGLSNYMFWDPLTPPGMLREISERSVAEGVEIHWGAEVKFEHLYTDPEYVRVLARGGCDYLQFGFESGVQRVLDDMLKGNDLAQIEVILERLHAERIAVGVFWFIGFPTELEEDARESWRYIVRHRSRIAVTGYVGTFGMGPGIPVFHQPERYGIEIVHAPGGDPGYRRLDGRDWDPEPLHRAFQARNDIPLIQSGAVLLYGRRRRSRLYELGTHARTGPPVFVRPLEEAGSLSIPPGNGFHLASDPARMSFAYVADSGTVYDLAPAEIELVRAVRGGAGLGSLLARPGARATLERLVDAGILDTELLREGEGMGEVRDPELVAR